MKSLEMKRRYYKRKRVEIWKKISKIAQENSVPTWMARLYFYYEKETRNFLFFRNIRVQENFKNEIKEYLGGNTENETTTMLDWKELYEILGEEATNKLSIVDMLETMQAILEKIECLSKKGEPIPYEFEGGVLSRCYILEKIRCLSKKGEPIPYEFEGLRQCYIPEENFPIIEDSIKRYLLTELPKGSEIFLELFKGRERGPLEVQYIGEGYTRQFNYQCNYEVNLYLKVKFSYLNET